MASLTDRRLEVQLTTGIWTDIGPDVLGVVHGVFGLDEVRPDSAIASSGQLRFELDNSAQNSGSTLGYYSPNHANVRTGWTYGIPAQWVLSDQATVAVSSITRSGTTATVTTGADHGYSSNDYVTITGANQLEYNGTRKITVSSATVFTVTVNSGATTPATGTILARKSFPRFRGKVESIDARPGQYRERRVHVSVTDPMNDLLAAKVRELSIAIGQNENTLIGNVLDALPTDAQPPARSLDAGIDTYPYAFDNVGGGIIAGTLLHDIVLSGVGLIFSKGDGTVTYKTRRARATATSALTLSNDMVDLVVPATLENVFNRVRSTIHPKTIDAAATTVLWSQTGTAPDIAAGKSITVWGNYRDPDIENRLIGGTATVAPVATTDYTANTAADGTGSDRTSSLSVVATAFASAAKFVLTNNGSDTLYVTALQIRGKGVYDNGPRTFEAYTAKTYGDRPVDIDLPYQDSAGRAQDVASYLRDQFDDLEDQIEAVEFIANRSATFLAAALQREPTDVITVTETLTGLASTNAIIYGIDLTLEESGELRCRFTTGPAAPYVFWQLGTTGASEIGTTTVLGF